MLTSSRLAQYAFSKRSGMNAIINFKLAGSSDRIIRTFSSDTFLSSNAVPSPPTKTAQEKVNKKLSKIERLFGKSGSKSKKNETPVKTVQQQPASNTKASSMMKRAEMPENSMVNDLLAQKRFEDLTPEELQMARESLSPVKKKSTITSPILGNKSFVEGEFDESSLEKLKAPFYYKTIMRLIERQTSLSPQDKTSMKEYVKKEFRDRSKSAEEQYLIADNFVHIMRAKDLKSAKISMEHIPTSVLEDSNEQTYWNDYYQQHGYVEEWYCDWGIVKNFMPDSINRLNNNPSKQPLKVLDVGCGLSNATLKLCDHLTKQTCSVVGVDISSILVAIMKDTYEEISNIISFQQVDVRDMETEFQDNTFDFIFDKATFDSILSFDTSSFSDITSYESEIYRTLKPGGIFMLCSVTPFEGIEGFFSGQPWSSIKVAGKKNLLEDHTEKNRKLVLPEGSTISDAHVYFYHIKKASE